MRVADITAAGARLTLANYRGEWRYRADRGPHAGCSAAQLGPASNLAGLRPNTAYRYQAYGDENCARPLAALVFTTPALAYAPPLAVARPATPVPTPTPEPTLMPAPTPAPTPAAVTGSGSGSSSQPTPLPTPRPAATATATTRPTPAPTPLPTPTPAALATPEPTPTPAALPQPELLRGSVTATTARLTLANHTGPWHYRAAASPHAGCSPAVNGSAARLSGLAPDTAYTYAAYADADCAAESRLATASDFTTNRPALTAAGITALTARLTLEGWAVGIGPGRDGHWYFRYRAGPGTRNWNRNRD